jgi:phospholipase/lecithinase/hemolysin
MADFFSDLRSGLSSTLSSFSVSVSQAVASQIHTGSVTAAAGAPFSAMYVFGDSLSDTGNVSLATTGRIPVSPPYADRSFSNGAVWAQDLATSLGLPALQPSLSGGTDFAYGGANTGSTPQHQANGTDLTSQFDQFTAQVGTPQTGALYAIWIGSNDVLDIANDASLSPAQQQADVAAAVTNEVSVIDALVGRGARNFLVLDVPDLGKTPDEISRGAAAAATASSLAFLYNSELAGALQGLQSSGVVKVNLVDTFSLVDEVVAQPSLYGFSNVTDPVWTGNVSSSSSGTLNATGAAQNQFLYFDSLHPTSQAHALLATDMASILSGTALQGYDFNADRMSDLLWQNDDGSVSIWEMSGASIIGGAAVSTAPASWTVVGSGDFNGDGRSDILWQNTDGSVSIWEMSGTSVIGGGMVAGALPGWHVRGSGDFNADGRSDVLLQNDDGSIAIWEMNGATVTGIGLVSGVLPGWHAVGSGDFTDDGRSDILLQNDDGSIVIWEMNGTTITTGGLVSGALPGWHVRGTGDFNGDGHSDILLQNDNGSVAIWEMNGASIIFGNLVSTAPTSWHVIGAADFNGDGRSDILWQNDDGSASVWEMNGTSIIGGGMVSGAPSSWHLIGNGDMRFISGASSDTLSATAQSDEFVLTSFAAGAHTISGFDPSQDVVALSKASFPDFGTVLAHSAASGGGTLIALDSSSTLLIQGISPTDLHGSNFVFA